MLRSFSVARRALWVRLRLEVVSSRWSEAGKCRGAVVLLAVLEDMEAITEMGKEREGTICVAQPGMDVGSYGLYNTSGGSCWLRRRQRRRATSSRNYTPSRKVDDTKRCLNEYGMTA